MSRKKKNNTKVMLFSIVALIVVVLAIKGITSVVSKSVSKDKDATASSGQVLSGEEESIGDASDQIGRASCRERV